MQYALYEIAALGTLPAPTTSGTIRQGNPGVAPVIITFDMRRLLSIPPGQALPHGVDATADVDLRIVMDLVIDSL
ncbi:hypothetical protein PHMEG_00015477 [Phytophthora megakarya]|uniref:Uncharacterized protein n=1 Tax=Phytophthora megakarya TaxID=4795 RepID=A0A225W267_9STRA|nr:hypothetical protein PHMEG_00015477 [Phytophthora megakarya]